MTDPLRAFVERASDVADVLFRPAGQMLAYFYVEQADGKLLLIACPMGADEEAPFRIGTPKLLRRTGAGRWCFFTEAWSAGIAPGQLPADRPDRMEIVVFAAEEGASGRQLMASRQIFRGAAGARLLPLVWTPGPAKFVMAERGSSPPQREVNS